MSFSINKIIFGGLILRFFNAFYGSFIGSFLGGGADSSSFHFRAMNTWYSVGHAKYDSIFRAGSYLMDGGNFYIKILEYLYKITFPHIFIGSIFSVFIWYLSLKFLIKTMLFLKIDLIHKKKIMMLYCFLPSSILYTSLPLREPFQLLLVNMILYLLIKIIYTNSNFFQNILFLVICFYLLSSFHYSFVFSGSVVIFLSIIFIFTRKINSRNILFLLIIFISAPFFLFMSSIYNSFYEASIYEAISTFNQGNISFEARASYRSFLDLESMNQLILFIPVAFFQYLLEPLPNRISGISDAMLFTENIIRIIMLFKALFLFKNNNFMSPLTISLLFYFAIELVFSVGTTNWGTASRHHIPSIGLLFISVYMFSSSSKHNLRFS